MSTETTPLLERIASGRTDLIFDYLAAGNPPHPPAPHQHARIPSGANPTSLGHAASGNVPKQNRVNARVSVDAELHRAAPGHCQPSCLGDQTPG